jgi:hypothetical protein
LEADSGTARARVARLPDSELLQIVSLECGPYPTPTMLLARDELKRRGLPYPQLADPPLPGRGPKGPELNENNPGTVETIIPINRKAVAFQVIQFAAMLGAVYWLSPRRTQAGAFGAVIGALIVFYLIWPTLRACFTGVAAMFTDRGILNFTGGISFVAWHDIQSASIGTLWGRKHVELVLHDQDAVLLRDRSFRGWSVRKSVQKYGFKPSISAHAAQGGPEAVLAEITKRLAVRRDAV